MNWYTKRAALTGIYNTTELVMLQDSSPDFQDTWNFLDNRIQDVVNMATTAKQVISTTDNIKMNKKMNDSCLMVVGIPHSTVCYSFHAT